MSELSPERIKSILEAAILAADGPLDRDTMLTLFDEQDCPSKADLSRLLESLSEDYAERGIELKEVATGFRFQVRTELGPWVSRLWQEKPPRYSRAVLETLALMAYRQPITRGEIEQVRGVAVSSNIIKALEEREWIRVVGHRDVPGKPALYGTTKAFLDYFGLKRLDELPPLSELKDIGELEPQLDFDAAPGVLGDVALGEPAQAPEAATDAGETADAPPDAAAAAVDDAGATSAAETNNEQDNEEDESVTASSEQTP